MRHCETSTFWKYMAAASHLRDPGSRGVVIHGVEVGLHFGPVFQPILFGIHLDLILDRSFVLSGLKTDYACLVISLIPHPNITA